MQKTAIQIHSLNINKEFKQYFLENSGIKAELAQIKAIIPRMPRLRFAVSMLNLFKKPNEFVTISEQDLKLNKSRFTQYAEEIGQWAENNLSEQAMEVLLACTIKILRKLYLLIEDDNGLTIWDKISMGDLFIEMIETMSFVEGINLDEQFKILDYIKKRNTFYKEQKPKIIEATYIIEDSKEEIETDIKPERNKNPLSFEEIFKDLNDAEKIKEILKHNGYIDADDSWNGNSGNVTEGVSLIEILIEKDYTRIKKRAPLIKAFMNTFGVKISRRSFTTGGTQDDLAAFDKIIPQRNKLF